jgi:ATP-dependent Clp protease ATP-binding subunit ClpB
LVSNVHELKKQLNDLEKEAEKYELEGNLEKVAEITYGQIPLLEKDIKKAEKASSEKVKTIFIKEEINEQDISKVVSK